MIFTWYWVICDCEGGVGYLRVYHRLGHIFSLDLHREIAASKNFAKIYNEQSSLYTFASLSKYLPWWETERTEENIKVIRDHIVHYSWLVCFKNCSSLLSHHVHFSCEVFTLSRLTANWALWVCRTDPPWLPETPERVWMKYSKHRHLVSASSITRTGARSKYWHCAWVFPCLMGSSANEHRPGAYMSLGIETAHM